MLTRVAAACAEPFEVSDDADSVQMLTRSSQIGEFYVMAPPQVEPTTKAHTCDLLIYDEESDRHVRITWEDALKACCVGKVDADGKLETAASTLDAGDTSRVDPAAKMSHPTGKMADTKDLTAWYEQAIKWVDYMNGTGDYDGLDKDIRIVLARPFIEHMMHNVIMTVSGRDTGATRAIAPLEPRLPARTPLTRVALRVQCSARRTCSFRPTPKSRPSRATTRATSRRS